jgi:peptidoglycan-associated lipoprotein
VACSKAGLFAGRRFELTGHADPRGDPDFNRRLALRRAHAVGDYLVRRGVPQSCIEVRSQGEEQLVGSNGESWFFDRRVEISLLPDQESTQHD